MQRSWRMTVYDLEVAGSALVEGGPCRFFFPHEGWVRSDDHTRSETGDGFFSRETISFQGNGIIWVYEAVPLDAPLLCERTTSVVLSRTLELEFDTPFLLRADRIESPSRAVTPRHTHRGPGIRRLLYGRLLAQMGSDLQRIEAGQAWFETGTDPIIGTNISSGDTAFVRFMALPIELRGGKASFVPSSPVEAEKPRLLTQLLMGEVTVEG